MDDLGVPLFLETPKYGGIHVLFSILVFFFEKLGVYFLWDL